MGPLFFIVFINDMFLYPELDNLSLFATAHHSSKCSKTITHKPQAMATSADSWCEENRMKLSIIKTKVALVGSRQRLNKMTDTEKKINIFINDIQLEQVTPGLGSITFFIYKYNNNYYRSDFFNSKYNYNYNLLETFNYEYN